MISNELLLRNKKVADISLEIAKKVGITNSFDGNKIYSFFLTYNKSFEGIDLKDETNVKNAINKTKEFFKIFYNNLDYDFFSIYKKNDYMKRIFDILYLTILHTNFDGEFVSIEEKINEIKDMFGEDSYVYNLFLTFKKISLKRVYFDSKKSPASKALAVGRSSSQISNEYIIKDKKNMNFKFSFINTGIVSDETNGIIVKCSADINEDYIKKLILHIFSTTSFKYVSDLKRELKIFFYIYDIKYDNLEIEEMENIDYYNYSMKYEYNSNYDLEFIYNISYNDDKEKLLFSYLMQTEELYETFNIIRNKINNKWEYSGKYIEEKDDNLSEANFEHDFCSRYSFEYTFPILAETFFRPGGMIRLNKRVNH